MALAAAIFFLSLAAATLVAAWDETYNDPPEPYVCDRHYEPDIPIGDGPWFRP